MNRHADILAADLDQLRDLLSSFFANVSAADPDHPTERSGRGWTLHQTLAHVAAIAEVFYKALDDTLNGVAFSSAGLDKRVDLSAVNQREIAARKNKIGRAHV